MNRIERISLVLFGLFTLALGMSARVVPTFPLPAGMHDAATALFPAAGLLFTCAARTEKNRDWMFILSLLMLGGFLAILSGGMYVATSHGFYVITMIASVVLVSVSVGVTLFHILNNKYGDGRLSG